MINSIEDLRSFIKDKSFKKIFIFCGKKSFLTSGAEETVKNLSKFIKNVKLRKTQEFTVNYSIDNYNLVDLQYSKIIPSTLERKVTEYILSFATAKQFSKGCSIPIKVVIK